MPGVRRTRLAGDAERRAREQRDRLGVQVRGARERRGWTQEQLAARAGVGRLVVGRLERGEGRLDLELLQRVAIALGVPLAVSLGRDLDAGPADAGHLLIQELVLRLARAVGFVGSFELATRPSEPWRSVDAALVATTHRCLLVVECWNSIGDIGAAARTSNRKLAEARNAAVARWGPDGRAALLWVVRASARNRRLLSRYPEVFGARFGGSSRGWVATLMEGAPPPLADGLVWCDVGGTRLFEWRR
ncbi:MAG TPA: helix-turn-helix transcriptional regulator [Candidatus Sulfomarinibacteraceae bacterium]|nr:helix-turn-helix transcriptional regulator [Candidatus Sulfomarinibacteraceae bacterium]